MYVSFSKANQHADGKNGPKSALIHGHITYRVDEHHFRTGKRRLTVMKCGPIPGLEDETEQILGLNRLDFDADEECLHYAEQLAARLQWTFKAE